MKKYVLVIGASSEAYRQIRHHLEDSETEVLYSTTIDDAVFQLSLHRIALVVMEHGYACSDSQPPRFIHE